MSESKEILCPVCKKELTQHGYGIVACKTCDYDMPIKFFEAIQNQFDRAVEEAVRKEREDIIKRLSDRKQYFEKHGSYTEETKYHVNELAFLITWIREIK